MPGGASLRILGVSVPDVSDYTDAVPVGKWSQFYGALAERFELVDVITPVVAERDRLLIRARAFHPQPGRWRARAGFSPHLFAKRTQAVDTALGDQTGRHQLIMQLQTLCGPGSRTTVPYAIYTDNTMALTHRYYRPWARLSASEARRWMSLEADVCRSAAAVFTFSEFARQSVIDDYACPPERVVAVGAGMNQFITSLETRREGTPTALFVGMDFARKGGRVLLEAWPTVRQRVPSAELIIAGPGRDPAPTPIPGASWVGRVDRTRLAELYGSATVFVLPSLFEPWGHAFLEAMGYGLPCIGADGCAMPELIDDGVTGRLVAPGDAGSLADALIEMLADPTRAASMGRTAHARALADGSWGRVIDRIAAHLVDEEHGRRPLHGVS